MKQILILIVSFAFYSAMGQDSLATTRGKKLAYYNAETSLGVIYNKNSWTSGDLAADFTQSGGITASVVSNKIQVSGGAGTYTQLLKLNGGTYLEHWQVAMKVKIGTISGTSYGYGIGVKSSNTYLPNTSTILRAAFAGSATPLIFASDAGGSFATISTTTQTVSQTANDYLLITYKVDFPNAYFSLRNMTTGATQLDTVAIGYAGGNTSNFTIYSLGGTFTIDSLAVTSTEIKYGSDLFIGDSKTQGGYLPNPNKRWVNLLSTYSKSIVNVGAGGDRTTDILDRLPQILSLKPKRVFLAIGSNDTRSGVSAATLQANYASIANQLKAGGAAVYHLLPFYETSISQLTQRAWIISTFATDSIIDTYTPMTVGGRLETDNVHPNTTGHAAIAAAIIESGKLADAKFIPMSAFGAVSRSRDSVYQEINGRPIFAYKDSVGSGGGSGWGLTGNAGITSGSSFVGTTDGKGLSLRTNGINRLYIDSTQPYIGIGHTAPAYTLDIRPSALNAVLSLVAPTSSLLSTIRLTNSSGYSALISRTGSAYSTYKTTAAHDLYIYSSDAGNITILNDYASGNINFAAGGASTAQMTLASSGSLGIGNTNPTSTLNVTGSVGLSYVAKTATYTATVSDYTIDCTSGTFTVTLPTAVGIAGRIYVITNSGAGTITVGTTSSQTFVNVTATPTTLTMATLGAITVQSNGANWLQL